MIARLACVLAAAVLPELGSSSSPDVRPRPVAPEWCYILSHSIVTRRSESFAEALMELRPGPRHVPEDAEFMTLGPPGPVVWGGRDGRTFDRSRSSRLRVTLYDSRKAPGLMIEEIVSGPQGMPEARWSYEFLAGEARTKGLWMALSKAQRVQDAGAPEVPIRWLGPRSFAWTTRSDTLTFDHLAGHLFTVTAKARIR